MDDCDDLNSSQIKLQQTELIIKNEPDEVATENSALDSKYNKSFPTLGIKDQLLNTQVEVVPSICRIEDTNNIQAYQMKSFNSKFEMKVEEDYTIRETLIAEDTLKSKRNVGNYDFDALEVKLKHEEVIIKDEPEEVIENTSSLEIIQFDTIPVTLGIRDRIANTQIKVDSSIRKIEELLNICTCTIEVNRIPQDVFTTKMEQYLTNTLQNKVEVNCDTINCQVCTQQVSRILFRRHMLHHKITKHKDDDYGKVFSENKHLKVHKHSHKGKNRFKCKHCKKSFKHNGEFKKQMLFRDDKKSFKCLQCNTCFTANSSLKNHMLIHKGLKSFKCQQCDKCFILNGNLKKHMLIHTGLKPFKCQQCDSCFSQSSHLKRHMLIHEGLKPFKCQQCNKCFTQNSNLKTHILIHKGLKPFKCQQCNKCFTQNSNLKTHMLIHKGLKPFKCQQCNKCFTENGTLKKHMLIHKGLNTFKCQQCDKCFTQNSSLYNHMLIHKGLKPFKCRECNKCFTLNGTLKKHMLIHLKKLFDDLEQEEDESEEAA